MRDYLDNPIWHALTGPHARFAVGRKTARHYPIEISPFAAIAEPTAAAYADLAADLPSGREAVLFRPAAEQVPPGWSVHGAGLLEQMILSSADLLPAPHRPTRVPVRLGPEDAADMLALVGLTKPGPFGPRTVELGRYVGVRDAEGCLIAMAGERLLLSGYVELSAICVHPNAQGQGARAGRRADHTGCSGCACTRRGSVSARLAGQSSSGVVLENRFSGSRDNAVLWRHTDAAK